MRIGQCVAASALCAFFLAGPLSSQTLETAQPVPNWTAPPYWSPSIRALDKPGDRGEAPLEAQAIEGLPTAPLPFTAVNPCRIADTRGNGFTAQAGPPALSANVTRTFRSPVPSPACRSSAGSPRGRKPSPSSSRSFNRPPTAT